MLDSLKKQLHDVLKGALLSAYPQVTDFPDIIIETPSDKTHGEFATNVAMRSAKVFKKKPLDIAGEFQIIIEKAVSQSPLKEKIKKVEVKAPGFINFYLTPNALYEVIEEVFKQGEKYGQSDLGKKERIQIEFVSANPTGPLSVAHARQAAVGDVLGNVLGFLGFDVTKEYYVNDGGNQINILGESIKCRALEILGENVDFPEDGYQGQYIKEMAEMLLKEKKVTSLSQLNALDEGIFSDWGKKYLLKVIEDDLKDFGVVFDEWTYESKVADKKAVEAVIDQLAAKGHVYDKDGARWFKSTDFGDDKDRVLKKSDGSFTYLSPDIVYHKNKFDRGFSRVFNIWGPDHHGYIARIKAAAQALGKDKDDIQVLIVQLATLFREGKEVSMSTRRGEFISLKEVMDEVGVDAARFFFLMRHIKAHLEFDLELAKKQSSDNPVYYIQYAHARVYSVNEKAKDAGIKVKESGFSRLTCEEEFDLIKRMGEFPEMLSYCYNQLDPYPLVSYMQELATAFHRFYDSHRVVDADQALSGERLSLINAARIVFANGLKLLGVGAPKQM